MQQFFDQILETIGIKETKPLLPNKINTTDLFTEDGSLLFVRNMKDYGFNVLRLDDDLYDALMAYLRVTALFFEKDTQDKIDGFSHVDDIMGQINKGYILVKYVKEFLKLKKGDAMPEDEGFAEAFDVFWERINEVSDRCYDLIATAVDDDGEPFMDEDLYTAVRSRIRDRSSISMIHYFARLPPGERPDDDVNGDDEDGMSVPSKTHTGMSIL
eukprot:TRINITY_DN4260_c0_g1_i3.p1 TRINITY_DN4260_c0_g1~~TRINITY_DN4260_c0_g1_i3.p1  ORF type:complete len:214 (-),score=57.99 TRINITY_DN4260_c0_g1_i3:330-971(-)